MISDSDNVVQALAPKYFNTRFLRVFVENVPFMVEKLGLKVLPCVISFIKGVAKDRFVQWLANALSSDFACRIIGFEELGNADSFSTATLEFRLLHTGSVFLRSKDVVLIYHQSRCNPKGAPLGACCQQRQQRTYCGNTRNPPTPESP